MSNLSSTQRTLIAIALIICLAGGAALYLYHSHYSPVQPIAPQPVSQPMPSLLSLLPSDAPVIAFADVAALRSSDFQHELESLLPAVKEDRDYAKFVHDTGFDFSRDLNQVALAAWPDLSADVTDVQSGRPPSGSSIAIADGQFDDAKIKAYALRNGKLTKSSDREVYEIEESSPRNVVYMTFLAPGRIAIGSGRNLDPIFRPASKLATLPSDMQARMARVGAAPIFAVGHVENLPSQLGINFGNSEQLRNLLASVKGFAAAGQPKHSNLDVAADLDCDSASHSLELATLLDGLRWIGRGALADPANRKQMTRNQAQLLDTLLRVIRVTHDERWLELRLEVTPAILRLAIAPNPGSRHSNH